MIFNPWRYDNVDKSKRILAIPTVTSNLVYNGSVQVPSFENFDENVLSVRGEVSATNAGTYYVTFSILNKAFYYWEDGTSDDKTASWEIDRQTIPAYPSQANTLTYTGSELSPTWNNYDVSKMNISGTTSGVNAGIYNVVFNANENYKFNDRNTTYFASWTIGKADPNLTLSASSVTLDDTNTYKNVTVTRTGGGTISASSSNTSIATVSVTGSTVKISSVNNKRGNTVVTVSVSETDNYKSSNTSIEVTASFPATIQWNQGTIESSSSSLSLHTFCYNDKSNFIGVDGSTRSYYSYISENGINWSRGGKHNDPFRVLGKICAANLSVEGQGVDESREYRYFFVGNREKRLDEPASYTNICCGYHSNNLTDAFVFGDDAIANRIGTYNWLDCAYGNETLVVVCTNSSIIAYGTNVLGLNVTSVPTEFKYITYGNGKFIATAMNGDGYYSTNIINWYSTSIPVSNNYIYFVNGRFFAFAHGICYYSSDGLNWNQSTVPKLSSSRYTFGSVAYGNGVLMAGSSDGIIIQSKDNGETWYELTKCPVSSYYLCYGKGNFVCISDGKVYYTNGNIV